MLNHIVMAGRLTRGPELRNARDTPVCSFRIACDRDYKNKDGEKETDFVEVVVWRKLAETVEKYVHTGDMIYVEGKIQSRSYEDKQGITRYITEVWADDLKLFSTKKDSTPANG